MNKINGTSKLVRAKFGPGMLLQHEDLELLNSYTRNLSRIMFKSLFGCGVVCGLVVKTETDCGKVYAIVQAGVAIACSGDPIWVPKDERIAADEKCDPELGDRLWVILCSAVKCCGPRTSACASDDDEAPTVCTREIDGYEIRIVKDPGCACGCAGKKEKDESSKEDAEYKVDKEKGKEGALENNCKCADPTSPCHVKHYAGDCGCSCSECAICDCDCVILARLDRDQKTDNWNADHKVRRFVRPVLMRDPANEPKVITIPPDPLLMYSVETKEEQMVAYDKERTQTSMTASAKAAAARKAGGTKSKDTKVMRGLPKS